MTEDTRRVESAAAAEWIIDIFAELIDEPATRVYLRGADINQGWVATCATQELAALIVDEHNKARESTPPVWDH